VRLVSGPRVCHLGKFYPPSYGGIETFVRTLARAQAELGARVSVVCMNHEGGPTVIERDGGVEVERARRLAGVAGLDVCPGLVRRLARLEADVIHLHVPNPTMILALLAARPAIPIVVGYHSDHVRQRVRGLLFRAIERFFYDRVARIAATSPVYAEGSPLLQTHASRVRVLPPPVDVAPFAEPGATRTELAARLRASHEPPLWLVCGRLVYYKAVDVALRALASTRGTLLVVGDGPERSSLEAEARRLALERRVVFEGNVPDAVPYYLAADALWFPSNARSEALGIAQLEAMACGLPIVNAAIPASGVGWAARDGESAITVPLNDAAALARAAERIVDEPGLRERLGAGGRARVLEEFEARVVARRSLELYAELVAEPAAARRTA
jgi:rhamnosyl/mannosyltransferase